MQHEPSPAATLVVTTIASFLTSFAGSSINVALPSIGRDLHGDAVMLNWIVTAFLLSSAMLLIPMGRIADLTGRRRMLVAGLAIYAVTGVVSALAGSVGQLVVWRAVQGVGGAMLFPTSMAILVSMYPGRERGRVIGINTGAVYVGLSAGPFLGGILTQAFGWQSTFLINAIACPVLIALVVWKLPSDARRERIERFDVPGSALYAGSLAALLLGFSRLPTPVGVALSALGVAGIAAFVVVEQRVAHPVLDVPLFRRNRAFAFSNLAAMINYSATFAVAYFISLYLQSVRGMDAETAGFAMVVQPALQALLSPVSGRLSDRVEPRLLASAGMALTAAGLAMLVALGPTTPVPYVEAALALLGVGFALFSSPNMNAIMGSVGSAQLGVANATLATMRVVGQMLSMAFALLLLSVIVGRVQLGPDATASFLDALRACFAVFASLCVGGIFASLARGKLHAGEPAAGRAA